MLFEIGDLFTAQRHGELLLLLESLPFRNQTIVKRAGLIVSHERVHSLPDSLHVGLIQDRLAEFLCLSDDDGFFGNSFHIFYLIQHIDRGKANGGLKIPKIQIANFQTNPTPKFQEHAVHFLLSSWVLGFVWDLGFGFWDFHSSVYAKSFSTNFP